MDDLISRQVVIEKLRNNMDYMQAFGVDRSLMLIDELPSVGAVESLQCDEANKISDLINSSCNTATTRTSTTLTFNVGGDTDIIQDKTDHDEIAELREMIEKLKGRPYYMKIQCHNCGAPLVIDSRNHLIKCKYCHTAYFSGTQLVSLNI